MKIFDCHYHFENLVELSDGYYSDDSYRNVIINYVEQYKKVLPSLPLPKTTVSLIFDYRENYDFVKTAIRANKLSAIKIHSRIQKIAAKDYDELLARLSDAKPAIPIIVDAFYYGDDMLYQPNLEAVIRIAREFPNNKIIVAHSGGYEILKYFFHLRRLENIYWDLSFSLQYLQDTSCLADLKKLIRFTDKGKIMYGSDCPWAEPKIQMEALKSIADELNLTSTELDQLFFENAFEVFNAGKLTNA